MDRKELFELERFKFEEARFLVWLLNGFLAIWL